MSWKRNPVDLLHNKLRVFPAAKMYSLSFLSPLSSSTCLLSPHICIRYAIQLFIPFSPFFFFYFFRLFTLVLINEKASFLNFFFFLFFFFYLATITNKLMRHSKNKILRRERGILMIGLEYEIILFFISSRSWSSPYPTIY
jgi:hypothetical protein